MKKKPQLPLPLQAMKEFADKYPGCWEYVEYMRDGKGKDLPSWDDICYLPISASLAIMTEKFGEHNLNQGAMLSALASWRQYKEIYSFSSELKEMLLKQANEDIVVPIEILYRIPYNCVYIDTSYKDTKAGFFVFFEHDMSDSGSGGMELRFVTIKETDGKVDYIFNNWLHLKHGWTISDGIKAGREMCKVNINSRFASPQNSDLDKYLEDNSQLVSRYLQLLLYICAENADIVENPAQKQITRRSAAGAPKDAYREIRAWDVGFKIARQIRQAKLLEAEPGPQNEVSRRTSSHRPHTRRGHWHHYWIGSLKGGSRKLILKWIAPIFVGGNSSDIIATINKIEE